MKQLFRIVSLCLAAALLASALILPAAAVPASRLSGAEERTQGVQVAVRGGFVTVPAEEVLSLRGTTRQLPGGSSIYSFGFDSDPAAEGWTFLNKNPVYSRGWKWDDASLPNPAGMKVFDGTGCIYSQSFDNLTSSPLRPDDWAISPAVPLPEEGLSTVSFWAIGQDAGYTREYFAVYAGTSPDVDEMTRVSPAEDFRANPDGKYHRYTVDLTAFAGQTVHVAIRHYNSTDQFALVIDAVEISSAEHPFVFFDPNGGTVEPAYVEVTEGSLSEMPRPVREGYRFAGWFDNLSGGRSVCAGKPIPASVTAYARWVRASDQLDYAWDFNDEADVEDWSLTGLWARKDAADGAVVPEGSGVLTAVAPEETSEPDEEETEPSQALTPVIKLPYDKSELSFLVRAEETEPPAGLTVFVVLEDGTVQQLGEPLTPPVGNYAAMTVSLSDLAGQNVRLGFRTDGTLSVDLAEIWGNYQTYDLTVGGVDVTDLNHEDILGDGLFTFDRNKTLTILGDCDYDEGAVRSGIAELELVIEEDAALVSSTGPALLLSASARISGKGKLSLYSVEDSAIALTGGAILTVDHARLLADGLKGLTGEESGEGLNALTAWIILRGEEEAVAGLDCLETVNCGIVSPEGGIFIDHTVYEDDEQTIAAEVVIEVNRCTVTFDVDGRCEAPAAQTILAEEIPEQPDDPEARGWIFDGWFADEECMIPFDFEAAVFSDVTVYAAWHRDNPFVDVKDGKWYFEPVMWAYWHNPQITAGSDPTHFSPDATCTRAQVMTFLWKAEGAPEPASMANPFTDVKPGKYYEKPVLWAYYNDPRVTGGTSATTFGVGNPCKREQVVTFLWKAAGAPEPEMTTNPFTDVKEGTWYYKAVLWAAENGITSGMSATTFGVGLTCTRAQIVTFLYAAYGKG